MAVAMVKLLPLFVACMACAPASNISDTPKAQKLQGYATQTDAPSPDYALLLKRPTLGRAYVRKREATSPRPRNAKQIGDNWIARLKTRGALLGYGISGKGADGPVNMIDTGLTIKEFDSWTKENRWQVPSHIDWNFVPEMTLPRVSEAAKPAVRVWPSSTARTGMQNMAAYRGRVELRDGCLFVGLFKQPADKLAWFHAEMGLDIDSSGYFVLRDRVGGQTLTRLGEDMSWAGPAGAVIDAETKRALQDACGPAEIFIVGSPQSNERFLTLYPHLRGSQASPRPAPR